MRYERARLCADAAIARRNLIDRRALEGEHERSAMAVAMVGLELLSRRVCSHCRTNSRSCGNGSQSG